MLLDPTGHVVWAYEIAHLTQHEREGAPHANDVTFLLTTHVSSFELQLMSEGCAQWLTRRFLDGERARRRARRTGMESEPDRHEVYQIVVNGHLDSEWSEWFDGLTITLVDSGETILTGPIVDQTALHGVLIKIRDLGLPLLRLSRIEPESENESNPFVPQEEEGHGA